MHDLIVGHTLDESDAQAGDVHGCGIFERDGRDAAVESVGTGDESQREREIVDTIGERADDGARVGAARRVGGSGR